MTSLGPAASRLRGGLQQVRPFVRGHFSQEGEDILLERIFGPQTTGTYVDVGAHHPFRFSNTYWAYRRGWRGVNIDATPGFDVAFRRWRSRDVNVTAFVAPEEGQRPFTVYSEPALNTGTHERVSHLAAGEGLHGRTVMVRALRLDTILERCLSAGTPIDLLSIDVEGNELDVLKSNDWSRFRPRVVVIEVLGCTLATVDENPSIGLLTELGFTPVSMLYHSVVLISDPALLAEHWG